MIKLCQHPGCGERAVWAVKSNRDTGAFLVCVAHRGLAESKFRKLTGEEPKASVLAQAQTC
jgi:hypothetical protein